MRRWPAMPREGFGTPLRTIATDAGVSAALILHHFGSKQGLHAAVDQRVLGVADEKLRLHNEGNSVAAAAFVMGLMQEGHLPGYLARSLVEGGDAGQQLFTSFVDVTERALLDLDLADRRMTAAVLVTQSLGMMIMAPQVEGATGDHPYSPDGVIRYALAAIAIYGGAIAPLLPPGLANS